MAPRRGAVRRDLTRDHSQSDGSVRPASRSRRSGAKKRNTVVPEALAKRSAAIRRAVSISRVEPVRCSRPRTRPALGPHSSGPLPVPQNACTEPAPRAVGCLQAAVQPSHQARSMRRQLKRRRPPPAPARRRSRLPSAVAGEPPAVQIIAPLTVATPTASGGCVHLASRSHPTTGARTWLAQRARTPTVGRCLMTAAGQGRLGDSPNCESAERTTSQQRHARRPAGEFAPCRAQRRRSRVPALHAPDTTQCGCRSCRGTHLGQVFLILHATRSSATAPPQSMPTWVSVSLRRRPAAPLQPYSAPARRPGRPPRPCGRSLAKGAACRRPARRAPRAPSPDARCGASSDPAPRSASPCLVRGARCARPEGLAEAQDPSNRRGHRSVRARLHRHTPAVPAHLFVDFLATTR